MTNDEIFAASLPILLDSLFTESIEAAHEKAKEGYFQAKETLLESLTTRSVLMAERYSPERNLMLEGVRISIRHTIREMRFLRSLRTKLVRVLRGYPPAKNGTRLLPYGAEGRFKVSEEFKRNAFELCTCLMPYLVPTAAWSTKSFAEVARMRRTELSVEHKLAEEWHTYFPELFYGFAVEPPLSVPARENHPLARELFDRITATQILSPNELLLLERGLLA